MSKLPCSSRNLVKFKDDRLHAVSSKNMYSEHGLEALIFPVFAQVCHLLMVLSYCTPGSAQDHAASATVFHRSAASSVSITAPVVRARGLHEVVGHADRVVRVLAADGVIRLAVEVALVACGDQGFGLLLLAHLP